MFFVELYLSYDRQNFIKLYLLTNDRQVYINQSGSEHLSLGFIVFASQKVPEDKSLKQQTQFYCRVRMAN